MSEPTVSDLVPEAVFAATPAPPPYAAKANTQLTDDDMILVEGGTLPEASKLSWKSVRSFYIGRTEVTVGKWREVQKLAVNKGYSELANVGAGSSNELPVRHVNWYDCVKWCNARSEMEGLTPVYQINGKVYRGDFGKEVSSMITQNAFANGYRLPTEAEWEWAARGGVKSFGYKYSGSDNMNVVGWYNQNSSGETKTVGTKSPNEIGIYDMSGNVMEWCWDLMNKPSNRCFRGGNWFGTAEGCDVSVRNSIAPIYRNGTLGFRLARSSGN